MKPGVRLAWAIVLVAAVLLVLVAAGPRVGPDAVASVRYADDPAVAADDAAAVLTEHLEAAGIPGGALVVADRDGTVEARGVGETADGDPVTGRSRFVIGSTTKSFTALAVMQLVEDGRLALTDPVVDHVPLDLADGEPVDEITVQHLLEHTSGLDDLAGGALLGSSRDGTPAEAVAELDGARLLAEPGEQWRYANANYVLAGLVVEAASGRPYADYLAEAVLEPLGMEDTVAVPQPGNTPGHRYWFGVSVAREPVQREAAMAAGYLASTAEDLGRYLSVLLGEGAAPDGTRILSAEGVRTLLAPGPEARLGPWATGPQGSDESDGSDEAHYALGWMVGGPWRDETRFHPGNTPDSSAMIALFPEHGVAAAVLVPAGHEVPVPGNPSLTDRISRAALHAVLGEDVPEPTSRWDFYLWFDLAVLVLGALLVWRLVRAVRALPRRVGQRSRGRWLRPVPALLLAALLLVLPALWTGWTGLWTWAPDLALALLTFAGLVAATAATHLLAAVAFSGERWGSDGASD